MSAATESARGPLLSVRDLAIEIKVPAGLLHAVRGVSFDLARGETLCLVGESGCGKSLTALALMDLLPQKSQRRAERLDFDGQDLLKARRRRMADLRGADMAMIFQEPMTSLNPVLTIGSQLIGPFVRHGKGGHAEARQRALYLLERVGIPSPPTRMRQYPHELSGGLRQRVMIAMALMCQPALIIADEPTTALDVTIQAQLLALLADLRREFQMSLLLITHDLGLVARFADKVAVMYAGEIVEAASTEALFDQPAHPYTRALMECLPTGEAGGPDAMLGTIPGIVPSLMRAPQGCAFRERCSYAFDDCAWTSVPMVEVEAAGVEPHESRCLLQLTA